MTTGPGELDRIGLFPLPNVVLLPHMTLPLRVFEPRYCQLVADCTRREGAPLVIVRIHPGHENDAFGNPPFCEVGCLGRIVRHATHADGRASIVVRGITPLRLSEHEAPTTPYRQARAAPLPTRTPSDADMENRVEVLRACLYQLAGVPVQLARAAAAHLLKIRDADRLSYELGAGLLGNIDSRQALLECTDVLERLDRGIAVVTEVLAAGAGGSGVN